jgi:threonine/homoserine/homoserine lactone efflux protein
MSIKNYKKFIFVLKSDLISIILIHWRYSKMIEIFLSAMIVGFSGAIVPGPMFVVVLTQSSSKGIWASFFISLGHSILELLILILFLIGILKFADNPVFVRVIGVLGGVALLYIASDILYKNFKKKISIDLNNMDLAKMKKKSNLFNIFQGALTSAANPYWLIWWLTIGSAFLLKSRSFGYPGIASFYFGHISADFIWYMFVGILISKGRRFISMKVYRIIMLLCSLFLVYLGIKFIIDFLISRP